MPLVFAEPVEFLVEHAEFSEARRAYRHSQFYLPHFATARPEQYAVVAYLGIMKAGAVAVPLDQQGTVGCPGPTGTVVTVVTPAFSRRIDLATDATIRLDR